MGWAPEHDAALKRYILAGLSFNDAAGAINAEFKTSYSRNACIGRAGRIGMGNRNTEVKLARSLNGKRERENGRNALTHRHKAGGHFGAPPRVIQVKPPKPRFKHEAGGMRTVATDFKHLDLLELTEGLCKWPSSGDGPFTFCGCAVFNNINALPYCAPHYALATRPSSYDCKEAKR